jgi:hypothetical protein
MGQIITKGEKKGESFLGSPFVHVALTFIA